MKNCIELTSQEANQILVSYIAKKYNLKAKFYDVNWDFSTTPVKVRITKAETPCHTKEE